MKTEDVNIIKVTESLSENDFVELIVKSTYVLCISIVSSIEQDVMGFEGSDTWYFDQYLVNIDEQIMPNRNQGEWTNRTLCMPGRKKIKKPPVKLEHGERLIVFYKIDAMADGYSLEGMMRWSENKVEMIRKMINLNNKVIE